MLKRLLAGPGRPAGESSLKKIKSQVLTGPDD